MTNDEFTYIEKGNLLEIINGFLQELTRLIEKDDDSFSHTYGTEYENDLFMIHPFCWCFKEDCGWCNGSKPNFLYKPFDFQVTWYKYISRDLEVNKSLTHRELCEMMYKCFKSVS